MKKLLMLFALSLAITSTLSSQDAKVIQLSDADARSAKDKWLALQDAQKDWDQFVQRTVDKYTAHDEMGCTLYLYNVPKSDKKCRIQNSGWQGGINFSDDLKYIVPKPYVAPKDWGSCVINTPATGSSVWPSWTVQ